jgi:threonine dehydrogenase-like Zn-dependent dehydrogenase
MDTVEPVEVEIPRPGPGEVLAEIRCFGICGSDVGIYEGTHWIVARGVGGHGHETGAIAVEAGRNAKDINPGDRNGNKGMGSPRESTWPSRC